MNELNQTRRLHPLLALAAAAVILFSGVGIAKMMNWLPASSAEAAVDSEAQAKAEAERIAAEAKAEAERVAAEARAAADKAAEEARIATEKAAAAKKLADEKAAALKAEADAAKKQAAKAEADAKARAAASSKVTSTQSVKADVCASCGVITAVTPVAQAGQGSGMGAVAGAILGGVLGHQVGGGNGKKVATAAGAIGGAYAGNMIEGKARGSTTWNVSVRFDDGRSDVFSYPTDPQVSVGERVQLSGGQLVRR